MVVIGLGTAGCGIVDNFSESYRKIKIKESDFPKSCLTEEDFENKCPEFSQFQNWEFDECWFFVCGGSKCSSASLRLLETIKDKKINVGYVFPDLAWASPSVNKRHKIVFNVLQEYARSGLIDSITIFSNKDILNIIGSQSITTMYGLINKQIANAVETVEWFNNQDAIIGDKYVPKNISRIRTLSIGNMKKDEEKLMFLLDNCTEACYIYSISTKLLETDKTLLAKITDRIKKDDNNQIKSSFIVFGSEHQQSFFYSIKYTHFIQPWEQKK